MFPICLGEVTYYNLHRLNMLQYIGYSTTINISSAPIFEILTQLFSYIN